MFVPVSRDAKHVGSDCEASKNISQISKETKTNKTADVVQL